MDMIRLEHIYKAFDGREVLRDFSMEIKKGEFLTVIGRSGCGKSTMLKMINGLHTPDQGRVMVEGEDVAQTDLIRLSRRIGYVIQNKGLFPHMSVEQNITYVPVICGRKNKKENHKLALRLMELVGLPADMLGRYPNQLSGGQQQRVGIARALATDSRILLMDEPFGALDEITKRSMQEEIKALQKKTGVTILFITHDIREALRLGDRVLVMDQGTIAQLGEPEDILQHPASGFVRELISGESVEVFDE